MTSELVRATVAEASRVRAREESAEVIVALRSAEKRQERRTGGTNSSVLWSIVSRGRRRPEDTSRARAARDAHGNGRLIQALTAPSPHWAALRQSGGPSSTPKDGSDVISASGCPLWQRFRGGLPPHRFGSGNDGTAARDVRPPSGGWAFDRSERRWGGASLEPGAWRATRPCMKPSIIGSSETTVFSCRQTLRGRTAVEF